MPSYLKTLRLKVVADQSIVGILSLSACTLKVLDLRVSLYHLNYRVRPLAGLCEELEAMAGHSLTNMPEALSLEVHLNHRHTD